MCIQAHCVVCMQAHNRHRGVYECKRVTIVYIDGFVPVSVSICFHVCCVCVCGVCVRVCVRVCVLACVCVCVYVYVNTIHMHVYCQYACTYTCFVQAVLFLSVCVRLIVYCVYSKHLMFSKYSHVQIIWIQGGKDTHKMP